MPSPQTTGEWQSKISAVGDPIVLDATLLVSLDERPDRLDEILPLPEFVGIAALDRATGRTLWVRRGVPPLAGIAGRMAIGYDRRGEVAAVDVTTGDVVWRGNVSDDRLRNGHANLDRFAPLAADVVLDGDRVLLGAKANVVALSLADGSIVGQATVCDAEDTVVGRLVRAGPGRVVATCVHLTGWDGLVTEPQLRWESERPSLLNDEHRLMSAAVIGLAPDLSIAWRHDPSAASAVGDRRPLVMPDGSVVLVLRRRDDRGEPAGDRGEIVGLDGRDGRRLHAEDTNGVDRYSPVALGTGVFFGSVSAYDGTTGGLRWRQQMAEGLLRTDGVALYRVESDQAVRIDATTGREVPIADGWTGTPTGAVVLDQAIYVSAHGQAGSVVARPLRTVPMVGVSP